MTASRSIKSLSVVATSALILGAFVAGPADAKKKKKPKPPPPPPVCAPYTPGEQGADAETTVVTPAATADAPVEVALHTEPGIGVGGNSVTETFISHVFQNVQVDSEGPTGLFVRLEMGATDDLDLYVNTADGEMVARAAGFNPEPAVYNDTEGGGHTEKGAEVIDGIPVGDCDGFTIDVAGATTAGGDATLKFWLES